MRHNPRFVCRMVIAATVTIGCVSCSSLVVRSLEDTLVFQPRQMTEAESETSAYENAWFDTPDGVRLHGWFAEAEGGRPQAVVLYTHGNAGNIVSRRWLLQMYPKYLNASILVFDYRGYGRSNGEPSESGILADARAARRWLARRTGVAEGDIVVVGTSLGGAVAVDLAARDGARALVLENTFTSLPDVAADHLPLVPVRWLMRTKLNSEAIINAYHGPLLQTHGDADRVVPFALGRRLFDSANEPKQFIAIAGGGHNDPPTRAYVEALTKFFRALPPERATVASPS